MANVYRTDHIGTLIKSESLISAQAAGADAAARQGAEDAAVLEVIESQKALLMSIYTDGQLRRADPDEPYVSAIDGLQRSTTPVRSAALQSAWEVRGTIEQTARLTEREVSFLKTKSRSAFKICLTSPSALALRLYKPGVTDAAYGTVAELATALGVILRSEVTALFQEGVQYVQLSGSAYHALYEGAGAALLDLPGKDSAALFDELLAVDVATLKDISKPTSATLAMHIGRIAELNDVTDRYERMLTRLLERLPIDRVLLEYEESREHDFASLGGLRAGQMAVLGLVRSQGEPDEVGSVLDRVEQAARSTDQQTLALSPRRGFFNVPGQSAADQLKAQRRALLRLSEAVQQFWGFEA
jgi:methionine synthase II (cobalamin-independent)